MKTLKEIEFEVEKDDDIYKRLNGDVEAIMCLTQEQAVREEVAWQLGSDWFDFFQDKIAKFGGTILWEESNE